MRTFSVCACAPRLGTPWQEIRCLSLSPLSLSLSLSHSLSLSLSQFVCVPVSIIHSVEGLSLFQTTQATICDLVMAQNHDDDDDNARVQVHPLLFERWMGP